MELNRNKYNIHNFIHPSNHAGHDTLSISENTSARSNIHQQSLQYVYKSLSPLVTTIILTSKPVDEVTENNLRKQHNFDLKHLGQNDLWPTTQLEPILMAVMRARSQSAGMWLLSLFLEGLSCSSPSP